MLSKKQKTEMNNRDKFITRIKDIYNAGITFKSPHNWFYTEVEKKVYSEPGYKNLSVYFKGELSGIILILSEQLYRHMEYKYQINGIWKLSRDLTSDEMRSIDGDTLSGHFWKDSDKPYYISCNNQVK